jgi:hypothetical protein
LSRLASLSSNLWSFPEVLVLTMQNSQDGDFGRSFQVSQGKDSRISFSTRMHRKSSTSPVLVGPPNGRENKFPIRGDKVEEVIDIFRVTLRIL